VGEFEQGKPVIEFLRKNTEHFIVLTFFSPSVAKGAFSYSSADLIFPLPFDFPGEMKKLVSTLRPDILILVKYDAWLNLLYYCSRWGCFIVMLSATFTKSSGRMNPLVKMFVKRIFSFFHFISSVGKKDEKLIKSFIPTGVPTRFRVLGDSRLDAVFTRYYQFTKQKKNSLVYNKGGDEILFVAGSTYTQSEGILFNLLNVCIMEKKFPQLKLIIVPHEIDHSRLRSLQKTAKAFNLDARIFPDKSEQAYTDVHPTAHFNRVPEFPQVLVINAFGVLADLYSLADIVFIGGSFRKKTGSVHSVPEGIVHKKPVITGPYIQNSPEACELAELGYILKGNNERDFIEKAIQLITNPSQREQLAKSSFEYLRKRTGASEKFIKVLDEMVPIL
jgi:3-deoxy-D-manno-octulosonic-acid transferase